MTEYAVAVVALGVIVCVREEGGPMTQQRHGGQRIMYHRGDSITVNMSECEDGDVVILTKRRSSRRIKGRGPGKGRTRGRKPTIESVAPERARLELRQ